MDDPEEEEEEDPEEQAPESEKEVPVPVESKKARVEPEPTSPVAPSPKSWEELPQQKLPFNRSVKAGLTFELFLFQAGVYLEAPAPLVRAKLMP